MKKAAVFRDQRNNKCLVEEVKPGRFRVINGLWLFTMNGVEHAIDDNGTDHGWVRIEEITDEEAERMFPGYT